MSNLVGSIPEGMAYTPRLGMTEDSLAVLERTRNSEEPWDLGESKPGVEALERGIPGLYLPYFDMLLTEDATWLVKVSEASQTVAVPMSPMESQEEPEQCPVIDSQEQGLSPVLEGQEEERSLEQVQSMVVGEVLKDIETACKLLNITPGRPPTTDKEPYFGEHARNLRQTEKRISCPLLAGEGIWGQRHTGTLATVSLPTKSTPACVAMTDAINHILTDAGPCLPAPGSL